MKFGVGWMKFIFNLLNVYVCNSRFAVDLKCAFSRFRQFVYLIFIEVEPFICSKVSFDSRHFAYIYKPHN